LSVGLFEFGTLGLFLFWAGWFAHFLTLKSWALASIGSALEAAASHAATWRGLGWIMVECFDESPIGNFIGSVQEILCGQK
jgi:uncharacterized protein (DUF697 family)